EAGDGDAGAGASAQRASMERMMRNYLTSVAQAGNLVVLKTSPGLAHALGVALDKAALEEVVGTVAGDDTLFAAAPDPSRARALGGLDVALLATPEALSLALAPRLLDAGFRVVDLSGAFRLARSSDYPEWYGFEHGAPGLLGGAAYGLSEWSGGTLGTARL